MSVLIRRMQAAGAVAALVAIGLASSPARAQSAADVATARELFKEAAQLANEGKWEEARERYERSLKLKRAAITLYSLGVAQHRTGRLVEALESYRAFLAEPVIPATQPWQAPAKESVAELEKRVASVSLVIAPAAVSGLTVMIDGQEVPAAALDRKRLVSPGKREIVASAKGYREARVIITVADGDAQTVRLTIEPAPAAPPLPALSPPAQRDVPAPMSDRPAAPSRVLPIVLMAGGAAAFGAGITVGMIGVGEAKAAPTRDGPEAGRARAKMIAGDVVGGVGIAAAGAGAVVLVVQLVSAKKTPPQAAITPFVTGREIGVLGRF